MLHSFLFGLFFSLVREDDPEPTIQETMYSCRWWWVGRKKEKDKRLFIKEVFWGKVGEISDYSPYYEYKMKLLEFRMQIVCDFNNLLE